MKKFFSKLLVFALVVAMSGAVSLFTACGNSDSGATDYEHTIVFYSSQGQALQEKTANAIKSFETKYPGWKVEHVTPGGYDEVRDKVYNDLITSEQPDLAYCYPDHVTLYLKRVVDLNKFINSTEKASWNVTDANGNVTKEVSKYTIGYSAEELADFVQTYWNEGYATNFGGYQNNGFSADSLLTVPFVKSTELLYYNKTALDECNLPVAQTWTELWAQCDKILKKYNKATPLGYDSEANWFITMCEQNGWGYTSIDDNNHYLFNGPEQAAWLEMLQDYYVNKKYFTTQDMYGNYTSALFTKGVAEGGCVYCIGSSGGASHQDPNGKFEWGIAPVPGSVQADGSVNKSVISQGPSLVMLTGGHNVSNPEEKQVMTWMFVKELLDPKFQSSFSQASGYNSCRISTSDIEEYQEFIDTDTIVARAVKVGEQMRADFFTSPAFIGSSRARDQVGSVIVNVCKKQDAPTLALATAYKNCGGK